MSFSDKLLKKWTQYLSMSQNPIITNSVCRSASEGTVGTRSYSCGAPNDHAVDTAGRHFIVDFYGASNLDQEATIEAALVNAAHAGGAVLLHLHIHKFSCEGGITGVALLAESHISVHTWPEQAYAAFDVFMCGDAKPEQAVEHLREVFQPANVSLQEIRRG